MYTSMKNTLKYLLLCCQQEYKTKKCTMVLQIMIERYFCIIQKKDGQGHFDVITKVNGMMCKQYYCTQCEKSFKSRTQHKYKSWCNICGRSSCNIQQEVICTDCNRKCRSQDCLKAHKQERNYLLFVNKFGNAMNVELQFKGMRETPYYMNLVK